MGARADATQRERGSTPAEMVVGAGLGLLALLSALALARGTIAASDAALDANEARAGARWALEQIARDVERAGLGIADDEEAIELFTARLLGVRGDLDRDDPAAAASPEEVLAPVTAPRACANDEVVVFLRRVDVGARSSNALFEADLDGPDRTVVGGTPVAARDGLVETIDAGPAALEDGGLGTLYRVHFVHDARRAGTGRFRVLRPLLDEVLSFRVEGRDASGAIVAPCGGGEDAAARACRASLRSLRLELEVASRAGAQRVSRVVALRDAREDVP